MTLSNFSSEIEVHIVESMDPNGPFGAKEASEGPLSGFLSALAAAVEDATGHRYRMLPITPEKIFAVRQQQIADANQGTAL